ncbi:MAG: hypothetical protein R3C11_13345 [Planctomycetaceae bacterium]
MTNKTKIKKRHLAIFLLVLLPVLFLSWRSLSHRYSAFNQLLNRPGVRSNVVIEGSPWMHNNLPTFVIRMFGKLKLRTLFVTTDEDLAAAAEVEKCQEVETLCFDDKNRLTSAGLIHLPHFSQTKGFLGESYLFKDSDLKQLGQLSELNVIRITLHEEITLEGLSELKSLKNLNRLLIEKPYHGPNVEELWELFAQMPQLAEIQIFDKIEGQPLVLTDRHLEQLPEPVNWSFLHLPSYD